MKTEESKLKASFTKDISANSGTTSSNCTVKKVPLLVHSSGLNTPNRSYVYQPKVPKPKAEQSSCTSLKNPWIVRSAVAFVVVIVIVIFASLQGKTSTDLENAKSRVQKLESVVESLRENILILEMRLQCATSDNNTDERGRPCPSRTGGRTGLLKNKRKGDRTTSTSKPSTKPTLDRKSSQGMENLNAQMTLSQKGSNRKRTTIYTHWGKSKCDDGSDIYTVYSGRVATLHSQTNPAVGSEYMCVPDSFEYTDTRHMTSGLYLSPVRFGTNMSVFRPFNEENCNQYPSKCEWFRELDPSYFRELQMFQVPCAVCRHEKRSATLVTPGRNTCYPLWFKMYHGVLMTKQGGIARSEHICVDYDADGIPGTNTTDTNGPFIQFVAYKCNKSYCPQNTDIPKALTCVVCTI